VEQIYLATLSRRPSVAEVNIALATYRKARRPDQGLQTVQYALFNLGEFLWRH